MNLTDCRGPDSSFGDMNSSDSWLIKFIQVIFAMQTFRSDIHGSLMMYPHDPNSSRAQQGDIFDFGWNVRTTTGLIVQTVMSPSS